MFLVSVLLCVGNGLCDGPITLPGVLPNVVCTCVISKGQQWGGLDPLGLSSHGNQLVT